MVVEVDGVGLGIGDDPRGDGHKVGDERRDGALEQGRVTQDHVFVVHFHHVTRLHH